MKSILKKAVAYSVFSSLAIVPLVLSASPASAQPTGLQGSYLGAGLSVGVTNDSHGDNNDLGGNVQGRFDLPQAPVSVRGAALFNGDSTALMPIITYDLPVSDHANLYAGAGYSFVTSNTAASPLGNRDSVVLTAGAEGEVAHNVVIYGDAKLGLDAYRNSSDPAVSLQLGAAYRF